ncbi:MAG: hypothetical protein PHT33_01920 [bacterium]|nr:hypothetical protein [bacterium]
MERTQLYLTPEQKKAVVEIGRTKSMTMAEVVREAVEQYIVNEKHDYQVKVIKETFGAISGLDVEERIDDLRQGWQARLSSYAEKDDK